MTPPPDDVPTIEICLSLRVVFVLANRQTEGSVSSILNLLDLHLPVIDHATMSRRLTVGIASQPLLAGFQELLRPAVVQALSDPLETAKLGDAVIAA
jgi:hypothetical protein